MKYWRFSQPHLEFRNIPSPHPSHPFCLALIPSRLPTVNPRKIRAPGPTREREVGRVVWPPGPASFRCAPARATCQGGPGGTRAGRAKNLRASASLLPSLAQPRPLGRRNGEEGERERERKKKIQIQIIQKSQEAPGSREAGGRGEREARGPRPGARPQRPATSRRQSGRATAAGRPHPVILRGCGGAGVRGEGGARSLARSHLAAR